MIWNIVSLIIGILWMIAVYNIGRNKKTKIFYIVVSVPVVIVLIGLYFGLMLLNIPVILVWIILIAYLLERIMRMIVLREVAGNEDIFAYFFVYTVPVFGWMIYQYSKLK